MFTKFWGLRIPGLTFYRSSPQWGLWSQPRHWRSSGDANWARIELDGPNHLILQDGVLHIGSNKARMLKHYGTLLHDSRQKAIQEVLLTIAALMSTPIQGKSCSSGGSWKYLWQSSRGQSFGSQDIAARLLLAGLTTRYGWPSAEVWSILEECQHSASTFNPVGTDHCFLALCLMRDGYPWILFGCDDAKKIFAHRDRLFYGVDQGGSIGVHYWSQGLWLQLKIYHLLAWFALSYHQGQWMLVQQLKVCRILQGAWNCPSPYLGRAPLK